MGAIEILAIVFVLAKLAGYVDWSWEFILVTFLFPSVVDRFLAWRLLCKARREM